MHMSIYLLHYIIQVVHSVSEEEKKGQTPLKFVKLD